MEFSSPLSPVRHLRAESVLCARFRHSMMAYNKKALFSSTRGKALEDEALHTAESGGCEGTEAMNHRIMVLEGAYRSNETNTLLNVGRNKL